MEKITFIRWGNLNPVKHKEGRLGADDENRSYHTAPTFKGFYAFPTHKIEPFLLGGSYGEMRSNYLKDDNGNKIDAADWCDDEDKIKKEYKLMLKRRGIRLRDVSCKFEKDTERWVMTYTQSPHKFSYEGPIWHHLADVIEKKDIIAEKGSWVKTTYKTYCEALNRFDMKDRFDSYMMKEKGERSGNPHTHPNHFAKDHYEVFIERL